MDEIDYKRAAFLLWKILDDIDSIDETCRDNDAVFRKLTRDLVLKRYLIMSGNLFDELWQVYFKGDEH